MTDPLEHRLATMPRSEPPAAWRRDILAAAERHARPAPFAWLLANWSRLGWSALAAAWLVILGLNVAGPRGPALYAVTPAELRDRAPAPGAYVAYKHRERALLLALAAPRETAETLRLHPRPWEL